MIRFLSQIGNRMSSLRHFGGKQDELDAEIRFHFERMIEDNVEAGMTLFEARREARKRFGGVESIKESCRESWGILWIENLYRDIEFAIRQLKKSPLFAVTVILVLGFGIGSSVAIYSVVRSVMVRPLPYDDADKIVRIQSEAPGTPRPNVSGASYQNWIEHAETLEFVSFEQKVGRNLIEDGVAEWVSGAEVSADYLDVFGIEALFGRGFEDADDDAGNDGRVVILSHEWWAGRFEADPEIVGSTINLDDIYREVVGVLPPKALFDDEVSYIIPVSVESESWRTELHNLWMPVVAKMKPGVSAEEVEAELANLDEALFMKREGRSPRFEPLAIGLQSLANEAKRPLLLIMLGAVALVLLIACANVAGLQLARVQSRVGEIAARRALGGKWSRVLRQLATEGLVIALLGGMFGLALAYLSVEYLNGTVLRDLPQSLHPQIDLGALAVFGAIICSTALIVGLAPAFSIDRSNLAQIMQASTRSTRRGRQVRIQELLTVGQVALSVVLLVGSVMLTASLRNVLDTDPGFMADNVMVGEMSLTRGRFENEEELLAYHHDLIDCIREIPGIDFAGTTSTIPFDDFVWGGRLGRTDVSELEEDKTRALMNFVGFDYFEAMGMSLLKGRLFTLYDNRVDAPRVAVVNERLAGMLFPNEEAVGKRIRRSGTEFEIVGIVNDSRYLHYDQPAVAQFYSVHAVNPWNCRLVFRTSIPAVDIADLLREAIVSLDPLQAITGVRTLAGIVGESVSGRRTTSHLITLFSVASLALAGVGLFGLIAFSTSRKEREIAVRRALGATDWDVFRIVLSKGLSLGLIGTVLGIGLGVMGARYISDMLYGVSPYDPAIYGAVAVAVIVVVSIATYLPARNAVRRNPIDSLDAQ